MVGDIYLGRVDAVLPGIQAAFLDIGAEKSAFLHASDLIESEDADEPGEPEDENGNGGAARGAGGGGGGAGGGGRRRPMRNVPAELNESPPTGGQVVREPMGSKGPRVTCLVTPAARLAVAM